MTTPSVLALRAEHAHALELFDSLTADEWSAPSACAGWRVQDVVQHMASTFHSIADASSIETGSTPDVEQNAEVPVQARRDWTVEQVMQEYREWSEKGIETLTAMAAPPMADMVVPLANLGSHPLRLLSNAIAFDHYCHLRHDIGAAVTRAADLPHDPLVLEAAVEWMLAGAPQMCTDALSTATVGVNLEFTDLDGVAYTLAPGAAGELWTVNRGTDASLPTARTSAHEFISWATKRSDWRGHVALSDDAAAPTLDALNII